MFSQKQICSICLEDDFNIDKMFLVDNCNHKFCSEYIKRNTMICPQFGCESRLKYVSCSSFLTPNLKKLWFKRIKEDRIPVTNRVYCPNPRCSTLMSEFELSVLAGVRNCCVECSEPFCINCKVPWHNNMSCDDYKKLHPNPTEDESKLKALANKKMWRQCGKCGNMIELSHGCVSVFCRCGHNFCFLCGAEAGVCSHGHNFYYFKAGLPLDTPLCIGFYVFVLLLVIAAIVAIIIYFVR